MNHISVTNIDTNVVNVSALTEEYKGHPAVGCRDLHKFRYFFWSAATRLTLIPFFEHTYCTRPLQSKPDGEVPPQTYGTPRYCIAVFTIDCPFDEDDGADCVSSDCEDVDGADVATLAAAAFCLAILSALQRLPLRLQFPVVFVR